MKKALKSSLSISAQKQYRTHWRDFCTFLKHTIGARPLPCSSYHIALYVTHLHTTGLKSNTIRSRLSAIAFYHKIQGHSNPTTSFLIDKLLKSYKKSDLPPQIRKPITRKILNSLLHAIQASPGLSTYDKKLYRALFAIMYAAALHSSEVCVSLASSHTLHCDQIQQFTRGNSKGLRIQLHTHKHSNGTPTP